MFRPTQLAAVLAAALLLSACSSPTSPRPSETLTGTVGPSPSSSAQPTQVGNRGGTLVVAIPGDIVRTDPVLASETNSSYVLQNVLEGLMGFAQGTISGPVPVLAASMPQVSSDGLTYSFSLRQNVRFHDGTVFDAAAVKFNFDRWTSFPTDLQPIAQYAGIIFGFGDNSIIKSVDVVDPSTVSITLKHPTSSFLTYLTLPYFLISSPAALKAGGADNSITDISKIPYAQGGPPAAVGTGPFKFKEWIKGDHVTIVRNDDYWNPEHAALLDQVVFKPVSDETAILNGLQAGDIDLAQKIAPIDVPVVKGNSSLQILDRGQSCNTVQVSLNQAFPPLNDLKVRQAIAYAVNKQAYIDAFYAGLGTPADNFMPLTIQYAKPLHLPTYDTTKAKDLLSSYQPGQLKLDFYYPSAVTRPYMPDPKGLFEAVSRDLTAVGFTIVPHTDVWSPDYLDNGFNGKYAAWLLGITCQWAGIDNFLKVNYFGYIDGKPPVEYGYKNDELDATMNQALAAPDEATAASLWSHAQDLLAADLPIVPLVNSVPPAAARSAVQGFVGAGNLQELLYSVWLK
jgi:peptide/nickel transport system substrate-binding protein